MNNQNTQIQYIPTNIITNNFKGNSYSMNIPNNGIIINNLEHNSYSVPIPNNNII